MSEPKTVKKTSIGGQALIEGIMMRGPAVTAMAVRHVSGDIVLESWPTGGQNRPKILRAPFIRGIFNFIDSLRYGYKCLMRSAELSGLEEEEDAASDPSGTEKKSDRFSTTLLMVISGLLGVALAIFLFFWLPAFLYSWIKTAAQGLGDGGLRAFLTGNAARGIFEGVFRILLFIGYMLLVSLMKDIKRVFMYHGAEHKTIFCYEAGEELTVENVRRQRRFHPRCGTSFMILMLIVGVIVSMVIRVDHPLLRTGIKLLTIPLVVGIGYELIKLAGRKTNWFTRAISAPGMWLQHITTKEPEDGMIECAIRALKEVIPADPDADNW